MTRRLLIVGSQLKAIREKVTVHGQKELGLEQWAWGRALGWKGEEASVTRLVRYYESGKRPIPLRTERLALMFKLFGIPKGWL